MADWTPAPELTKPLPNGGQRQFCYRDVAPAAPKPAPVSSTGSGSLQTLTVDAGVDASAVALDRAQAASAKRFGRSIDSASADLDAGRWSWPAIALCVFLCGGSLWGFYVSVWGSPLTTRQYPQTQPSITPGAPGVGVNHSRDLLIEWSRGATWKRLRAEEQDAARKAVEADR